MNRLLCIYFVSGLLAVFANTVSAAFIDLTVDIGAYPITSVTTRAFPSFRIADNDFSVKGADFTLRGKQTYLSSTLEPPSALALLFGHVCLLNGRRGLVI